MSRPLIGITCDYDDKREHYQVPYAYAQAVEKAGGLPLLIPYRLDLSLAAQIADSLDGIVFSGGDDVDPATFGEARHPKANAVDPLREKFERALFAEVEKRRLPTLAICMGSQLINVARGGSLTQFIPDDKTKLEHRKLGDVHPQHDVTLAADSEYARRVGRERIVANSSHKQAANKLGRGLRVIATAPDGTIEGFEDTDLPLIAVQWHPERMTDKPEHHALFAMLVERSTNRQDQRGRRADRT
jgi:putative glutamine amidotransferase